MYFNILAELISGALCELKVSEWMALLPDRMLNNNV